ncbi:MAG: hypothetical protein JNJ57_12665 [Saprospiraceae bacterium]|nr:hypothetical protein [Saprospiraceae bacterium]
MASNCRKPETPIDPLPPATQEGANTFGCYINGEPWVAEIAPYVLDPSVRKIDAGYDEAGIGFEDVFRLDISSRIVNDTTYEWIKFFFMPVYEEGELLIGNLTGINVNIYALWREGKSYDIDLSLPCNFYISKLDTTNNICAGVFSFSAVSVTTPDTIQITDGRFDVRYQVW